MEAKNKQRLVGLLILLAILAIFLPVLFHNSHPSTDARLSVRIPPKPALLEHALQKQEEKSVEVPAPQKAETDVKKIKSVTNSEQNGLQQFMHEPKAWTVQLGTFENIENANHLIEKLRRKGFDAYTRPIINAKGRHMIRVYVGPEVRRESALQLRNNLRATFNIKGVVRKYKIKTV